MKKHKKKTAVKKTVPEKSGRKRSGKKMKPWLKVLIRYLCTAAVFVLLFTFVFGFAVAEDAGLAPAVNTGDLLFYFRPNEPAGGDVVVYTLGGKTAEGRVLAVGGDVVSVTSTGTLLVNDAEVMSVTKIEGSTLKYPLTIPDGSVFVINSENADSRLFGPVSSKDVDGVVVTLARHRKI